MKEGIFHFLQIALVGWITASGLANAQNARVAVAGDASLANLIDVTTVELSNQPDVTVLDRAALDKLGQEQALEGVINAKDFSPIRLLPADGLVLLRTATQDGKTGVFARLVAVQPGVVLREIALPEGVDAPTQAQALVKDFTPYWSKLEAVLKGKITALSLLGLRFEVDAPETRDLERSINILLASRLSAEPDVLVLERWRLNDVVFEKSVDARQPSPFWTGSSLVDGSMRWDKNRVTVNLRVRPPHGAEISISDGDTADHLPGLVERLAAKIRAHPLAQGAWKAQDEADHYAKLGKWCLDNRLYEEGVEAIESALALGDTSRTTHMLQITAYALEAYPDHNALRGFHPDSDEYRRDLISSDSLAQSMASATKAAHLTRDYLATYRDFSSQMWNPEDPDDLSIPALYVCLRALRAAYDNGWTAHHPDETANLRHELQPLIGTMEERLQHLPLHLKRGAFLNNRAFYAGLWHEKPEDTIAFYRELLNDKDGAWMRGMLFQAASTHAPILDGDGASFSTAPWSNGPPSIVAWDGRSQDEVKVIWQHFIKELATSSDPVRQCDAFKFEIGSNLIIGEPMVGFWVTPWSDIDAFRAKAALGTNRPMTSAPAK